MLSLHLLTKRLTGQLPIILCTILLAAMFSLQLTTAMQESQNIDEGVHLSAGFSYWKTHDFRMNPEHPPLGKMLAALPLLFTKATLPLNHESWSTWNQWEFGDQFLYHNVLPANTILLLGRIPTMLLSIFLGILIFRASRKLFGAWPAVFSVTLYAFDPGFIAHGHYVTTDLSFAAFGFWSVTRLNSFLSAPTNKNLLWLGIALWITGLTKFSIIPLLISVVVTLAIIKLIQRHHRALNFKLWGKKIILALPIVLLLTWVIYGFDIRRANDDPRVHLLYEQREDFLQTRDIEAVPKLEQFAISDLGDTSSPLGKFILQAREWHIPNYAWLRGWISVLGHSVAGQEAYLLGEYRDFGWWYYFPVTVIVKTPLPTLLAMLGIFIVVTVSTFKHRKNIRRFVADRLSWFLYLAVPMVFFALSMSSHLNLGWRYTMFIYPFIFVLAGALASKVIMRHANLRIGLPLLLGLGMIFVQIKTYPNELGYFNALIGGSANGPKYLLDSNLDWGQDLPKLEGFMKEYNLLSIPFAYYGRDAAAEYLPTTPLPTTSDINAGRDIHGYAAISVGQLYRRDRPYEWLKKYEPIKKIGSSIYVYRLP